MSQIILANPPTASINLKYGESNSTFAKEPLQVPELKPGFLKVKVLMLSNDPAQRMWMQGGQDPLRLYVAPIEKGETVHSLGAGEVLESKGDKYQKGDIVVGRLGWAGTVVVPEQAVFVKADLSGGFKIEHYLSAFGLTGLTAYFGLTEVGQIKEGQSVLVSAASGATGSMVVQIAKHIFKAKRVIGIAGLAEKCKWVESLGADLCVNYRDADYLDQLSKYIGKDYVDIYFDNVGGETLSFALTKVKAFGHVVACGAIAGYNDSSKMVVTLWPQIITNRLRVQGFICTDYMSKIPDTIGALVSAAKAGQIRATEGVSVVDLSSESDPLEKVPEVWFRLFTEEKPLGKLLTKVA